MVVPPVNSVAVLIDPRHPKDAVLGVFECSDDELGFFRARIEVKLDLMAESAMQAVKTGYGGARWSCKLQKAVLSGICLVEHFVCGS